VTWAKSYHQIQRVKVKITRWVAIFAGDPDSFSANLPAWNVSNGGNVSCMFFSLGVGVCRRLFFSGSQDPGSAPRKIRGCKHENLPFQLFAQVFFGCELYPCTNFAVKRGGLVRISDCLFTQVTEDLKRHIQTNKWAPTHATYPEH
jgi:hypothetical protein